MRRVASFPRADLCAVLIILAGCFAIAGVPDASADEPLFPNAGFETGTLEGWTADGDAFAMQPTKGDNTSARNREPSQHEGDFWVGTYEKYTGGDDTQAGRTRGDGPTGTLTSPPFTVTQPFIKFRVGGGNQPKDLGVKLVVGETEQYLSSGFDSESMEEVTADVSKFIGKQARLVIYDNASGGWGHINADAFAGTDTALPPPTAFKFTRGIEATDYPDVGYDQPMRPQFHFTSKRGWINDPNGMVYDGDRFHLFFQHNPKGTEWGNMTWGHAVSEDMIHWTQLPHALLPYRVDGADGTIFSGTAVVDHNNSLGLWDGRGPKTLAAFYTFANNRPFYQALATSTDGGDSFTYHDEGRPVVPNQGFDSGERDPKVFWHEGSGKWVMALWVEREKPENDTQGRVRFFTSENLTDWEVASDLVRPWAYECMDVIFLPLDGDAENVKAVVYDASFDYEVGTFDGLAFTSETPAVKAGCGNFYAAQTFNSMKPAADGSSRCVQLGWMKDPYNQHKKFDLPFNGQMSVPNELTLRSTPEGPRLYVYPAEELSRLISRTDEVNDMDLTAGDELLSDMGHLDLVDLEIVFEPRDAKSLHVDLPSVSLTWHADGRLTHRAINKEGEAFDATTLRDAGPRDGVVTLRLLVDRMSVEAYAHGGASFGAHFTQPEAAPGDASIRGDGGAVRIRSLKVRELTSAWK